MFLRLLLFFVLFAFAEISILIALADELGWLTTFLIVVATGVIGTTLARQQGLEAWQKMRQERARGIPPTDSMTDALLILVAGVLLIAPGILTDMIGFLLLWPTFRSVVGASVRTALLKNAIYYQSSSQQTYRQTTPDFNPPEPEVQRPTHDQHGNEIIDVEFTRKNN